MSVDSSTITVPTLCVLCSESLALATVEDHKTNISYMYYMRSSSQSYAQDRAALLTFQNTFPS